jgi:glucose-6-phosphate dehydrogenase assembly protein OpcA
VAAAVSEDVWSEQDTNPDAIDAALRELLRERHAANQALAPARVLNLIVIVDRSWKGEIANRLERVGRYHASRTILCAVEEGREKLDAVAVMSYVEPKDGGIGVMHEQVEIDMGPGHLIGLETIVDPVVVSELPTVVWAPHGHEDAVTALRGIIDVMLLDSDDMPDPDAALVRAEAELDLAYVVDLAWLRTTPWRERLAASFDPTFRRAALESLEGLIVRHQENSTASALLLAGWLSSRLHWDIRPLQSATGNGAGLRGRAYTSGSRYIDIRLERFEQEVPGLAGVTVTWGKGNSLSLDRGSGGLIAQEDSPDRGEQSWLVLGASRGEGGILGEGVRQAHLRDPTYGPALRAARELCGDGA